MPAPTELGPVTHTGRSAGDTRGLAAVIVAKALLRTASAAAALVVGGYFVDLARHGVAVGSLLLGLLSGLTYLAELIFVPISGAASDRRGRRIFLALAPLLAAVGVLITPGASVWSAVPPLILVVVVVTVARLIEGTGAAMAAPATLSLVADATDGNKHRRGRLTSLYELASSGGIAVGAVLGPLLYGAAGLWAFAFLAVLYVAAAVLAALFVRDSDKANRRARARQPIRHRLRIFTNRRLAAFLPAWIAVNAILGTWVTAQITFVLAGDRHIPGQRFTGSLAGHETMLSAILGGYVLIFSVCILGWVFLAGRLPTLPTLMATIGGSIIASVGLMLANHGLALPVAAPIVIVGIFLEAGFTPAAITHLSDISAGFLTDRGLIMGVYSVVLGLGYLAGNVLGGIFAAWLAFDGLAWLTILLALFALSAVAVMIVIERRIRLSC